MAIPTKEQDILTLFNIEDEDVEHVSLQYTADKLYADILLRSLKPPCPICGNTNVVIKDYTVKHINHSILADRPLIIRYKARRYRCPLCGRSYYEHNPFVSHNRKISDLTVRNVLDQLKSHTATFSSVARQFNLSPTTAASLFDQHVIMPRLPLPELMCWDEAFAFHHLGENSKYVFMILDFQSQEPVDLLPSRKKEYLIKYFLDIPRAERNKVRMISTDMYKEYRYVIKSVFPDALHAVDHYHVSQELSRNVDAIRKRVMRSVKKYEDDTKTIVTSEYHLLKNFNWLIFKRPDSKDRDGQLLFDPGKEKKLNRKLNRYLNYYDIKQLLIKIHPDLETGWRMKDQLIDFYEQNTYESVSEAISQLIRQYRQTGIHELIHFANTLYNWREEIINSFIIVKHSHRIDRLTGQVKVIPKRLNNGLMENRNSILKTIKKASNGYTNWERFRNRCLYVLRPKALPVLYPVIPEKKDQPSSENKD